MKLISKMSYVSRISIVYLVAIMFCFFVLQTMIVVGYFKSSYMFDIIRYVFLLLSVQPFYYFVKEFLQLIENDQRDLLSEIMKKNVYLEHAAKILRHDMHSGINTYLPRGINSLKRRISEDQIREMKLEAPLRLINEGLVHTQQVYNGVLEFTNLVRDDVEMNKKEIKLDSVLYTYLKRTSYLDQVKIDELPTINVNESLFCTAIDNLIRNGLKYNDSKTKLVIVKMENEYLTITDNGRGMSQSEFNLLSKPYTRRKNQKEKGTGLGLNICLAIFKEHGYDIEVEKLEVGTKIRIKIL